MSDYRERRLEVQQHIEAIAALLRPLSPEDRDIEHALAVDDLYDALDVRSEFDAEVLATSFADVCRDFWARENAYSVRVPILHLVTEDEFAQMSYGPKETE